MVRRGGKTEATQLHTESGGEMEKSAGLSKVQRKLPHSEEHYIRVDLN
jgi:hypothetical protein